MCNKHLNTVPAVYLREPPLAPDSLPSKQEDVVLKHGLWHQAMQVRLQVLLLPSRCLHLSELYRMLVKQGQ